MSESCCHISSYGHRMKLEYTKMDTRSFPHEEKMVTADNVWHQSSSLSVLVYAAVSPRLVIVRVKIRTSVRNIIQVHAPDPPYLDEQYQDFLDLLQLKNQCRPKE